MAIAEKLPIVTAEEVIEAFGIYERNWKVLSDARLLVSLVRRSDCTHEQIRNLISSANTSMNQQQALSEHGSADQFRNVMNDLEEMLPLPQ